MKRKRVRYAILTYLLFIFFSLTFRANAEDQQIELLEPNIQEVVIGKRPLFKWRLPKGSAKSGIVILLDGVDVTELVSCAVKNTCSFRPIQPLSAGNHTLEIQVQDKKGQQIAGSFYFASRQTELFKEAYSKNSVGANYQLTLKKEDAPYVNNSRVDASLHTENTLKTTYWTFTANAQFRYLDQDHPVNPPEQKGFELINFLLHSVYKKDQFLMDSQLGDIILTESDNTINNYARRGGKIAFSYKNMDLHLFAVNTRQFYGFNGGLGVEIDPNDKLYGISGAISFWDNRIKLKTIYAKGGERGSSFGLSTMDERQKGEVTAIVLESHWFDSLVNVYAEYDFTKYDNSSRDEFGYETDKAYRITVSYDKSDYGISGTYEYMGPDYQVIGNQGLPRNREGFSLRGWLNRDIHNLEIVFSRYNDNVRDNKLYPTVYNIEGGIKYSFTKFPTLPISIYYQKIIQNSKDEPEYTPPVYFDTDTIGANIIWMRDRWNISFQSGYSYQNDKAHMSGDTTTITFAFSPSYNGETFRFSPSFSYNKSIAHATDIETDTYMVNWDTEWRITSKLVWSFAGNFNWTKTDDDSMDQQNLNMNCRLAYRLFNSWRHFLNEPTIGFRAQYLWNNDKINDQSEDSYTLMIDLTTNLNLIF